MKQSKRYILTVTAILAAVAVTVVYAVYDPTLPWFPKCMFVELTGFQCPGCGTQRALHALLQGNVVEALRYNALIFILVPVAAVVALTDVVPQRMTRVRRVVHNQAFIIVLVVIIAAWWIGRNL